MKRFTLLASTIALAATTAFTSAAPTTYDFDDAGVGGFAGPGSFTFDIANPLGTYDASTFSGGPGTFAGPWTGVHFKAVEGSFPSLSFDDGFVLDTVSYSASAIGGGNILPGSSALDEWNNFISDVGDFGIRITPNTTSVPDGGSTFALLSLGIVGLIATRRVVVASNK